MALAIDPSGHILAVSDSNSSTLQLWDAEDVRLIKSLRDQSYNTHAITFSSDGRLIASANWDNVVKLWDVSVGEYPAVFQMRLSSIVYIAFDANDNILVFGYSGDSIEVWDIQASRCLKRIPVNGNLECMSRDERMIAILNRDNTVNVQDADTGNLIRELRGHTDTVLSVAFSPDGLKLASGGHDFMIRVWDIAEGKCLHSLKAEHSIWSLAFSPNSHMLVSGHFGGEILLWNVQTGDRISSFTANRPYEGMNITGATGLTDAQRETLKQLGAIDEQDA
jgi:WD40 repeat protein